jgi:hypothetical protein
MNSIRFRRKIQIQAMALLVFLAVFIGLRITEGSRSSGYQGRLSEYIDPEINFRQVVLRSGGREINIIRDGDRWLVSRDGLIGIAREPRVAEFLDTLFGIEFNRLVSSRGSGEEIFGLTAATSSRIEFYDPQGRLLTGLDLGAVASGASERYLAIDGWEEIFAIPTSLGFYINQSLAYWRELRVWNADSLIPQDIIQFTREYPDGLVQNWQRDASGTWSDGNGEAPGGDLENLVRNFLRMEGTEIVDADDAPDSFPVLRIRSRSADGRILTLAFYRSETDDARYYIFPEEGPDFRSPDGASRWYQIPDWRFEPFIAW